MMLDPLPAPEPISVDHHLDLFDCGVASLNEWLKKHALKNERQGASRTYVVADDAKVIGYYCLAAGAVAQVRQKFLQTKMFQAVSDDCGHYSFCRHDFFRQGDLLEVQSLVDLTMFGLGRTAQA